MNTNGWLMSVEAWDGEWTPCRFWLTRSGFEAYIRSNPGKYRVYAVTNGEVSESFESFRRTP